MSEKRNQNDEEDQIAQLIELAQIPQSQQPILHNSSFAFQVDSDDESSDAVCWMPDKAAVGITMVSPPESSGEDEVESTHDDQFQTPPENLVSSSQEQHSAASDFIGGGGRELVGIGGDGESICVDDDCTIIQGTVDLCKDTVLGFSKVQTEYINLKEQINVAVYDHRTDDHVVTGCDDMELVVYSSGNTAETKLSEDNDRYLNTTVKDHHTDVCIFTSPDETEGVVDLGLDNADTELLIESDEHLYTAVNSHRSDYAHVITGLDETEPIVDFGEDTADAELSEESNEHLNTTVTDGSTDGHFITTRDETECVGDMGRDNAELSEESDDGDEKNDDTVCENPLEKIMLNSENLKPGHEFMEGCEDTKPVADLGGDNADTELSAERHDVDQQNDDIVCENSVRKFVLNNEKSNTEHEFMEGSDDDDERDHVISAENALKEVVILDENLKSHPEFSEGSDDKEQNADISSECALKKVLRVNENDAGVQNEDHSDENLPKGMKLSLKSLENLESSRETVELTEESCSAVVDIEDIEKFNYAGTSGTSPLGKRKLLASFVGQVKRASKEGPVGEKPQKGEEAIAGSSKSLPYRNQASVLNVLKTLAMNSEPKKVEPGNLMEIAIRRGMKFPTPFWPPPEGQ